jgi:guanylate kinase
MINKGSLIVISGFSGVGKGTVVKRLVSDYGYDLSISATTRAPREGEEHGREYFFMDRSEFENLIDYGGFIEWAQYVENYYGTPRKYVEDSLAAGKNIILEIEVMGAMKIKEQYPDALLIFISAPDIPSLRERLKGRGTESEETITKRLKRATEESTDMDKYDYIVVNDDLEECIKTVNSVIVGYSCRRENNQEYIKDIRTQLTGIW